MPERKNAGILSVNVKKLLILHLLWKTNCENDKFVTNIYRKKTFSGVYTNFKSFIPETG